MAPLPPRRRRASAAPAGAYPALLAQVDEDEDTVVDPFPSAPVPMPHVVAAAGAAAAADDAPPLVARLVEARARGEALTRAGVAAWLRAGHALDGRGADGRTALMWAAATGELGLLIHLVGLGARVNLTCRRGDTALALAALAGRRRCAAYLKSRGASPHAVAPLLRAAARGATAELTALLDLGVSPDLADRAGHTAVMHAAARGHHDAAELLLARGADPRARARSGRTAAALATARRDWGMVALLTGGKAPAGIWARFRRLWDRGQSLTNPLESEKKNARR